jgi:hypothetical protein
MKTKFSDPYITTAKFNSICHTCNKPIIKGNSIVYDKMRGFVYHENCAADIMQATREAKSFDNYGTDIY